jgi:hypothetical protein
MDPQDGGVAVAGDDHVMGRKRRLAKPSANGECTTERETGQSRLEAARAISSAA